MAKKKINDQYDPDLRNFAVDVTRAIAGNYDGTYKTITNKEGEEELVLNGDGSTQKDQVEELLDAERKFKDTILKYRQSTIIYKKFLQLVCIENKDILSARPYFRETAVTFSKKITPAIKLAVNGIDPKLGIVSANSDSVKSGIESLKKFDINYQFIKFVRDSWLGPFPKRAEQLFQRVHKARETLIENNMPLAINRARLFYRKTPKSHLTLMDMIGICSTGLVSGIDKYCGAYSKVFVSVCIGRMVGNLIDKYSETMLHFYPSDRRVLYKAHTIRGRKGIDDIHDLTNAVNESFKDDEKEGKSVPKKEVTVSELSYLMSAASTVSADATTKTEDGETFGVYSYTADMTKDIEAEYIQQETTAQMLVLAAKLPLLHRKVLKLKGIKI